MKKIILVLNETKNKFREIKCNYSAMGLVENIINDFNQQIERVTTKVGDLHSTTESQKDMSKGGVELF